MLFLSSCLKLGTTIHLLTLLGDPCISVQDHFISIPSTSVQGMYADFAMQAMAHHRALLGLAHDAGAVEVESIFEPDLGVAISLPRCVQVLLLIWLCSDA